MAQKWEQKDNLRTMTSKFNDAVQELEDLKESSTQVNEATEERFTQMEQSVSEQFHQVNEELEKKVSSVTAEDLGLGEVDNTSDIDKPVSTAQQQAIDDAKSEAMRDMLTSEEAGQEIENEGNPEVSAPVKEYIDERIQEIGAQSGITSYGIATKTVLGVVKASGDVEVNSETGVMSIPKLKSVSEKLDQAVIKFTKDHDNMGTLTDLQTTDKSTLVAAINETFQLGSERKAKLVENLTAMGITCSTEDSWTTLLGYILDIFTGTDTSDGNFTSDELLVNKIGYNSDGKVVGTMPDFYGSYPCLGIWRNDEQGVHFTIPETGRWNKDKVNIYASYPDLAAAIDVAAGVIMDGYRVLGIDGTATADGFIDSGAMLMGKIAYARGKRYEGAMPNRAGSEREEALHPDFPEQSMIHNDLMQYDMYGATEDTMRKLLVLRAPYGYYDGNTRVYATPEEVAGVLGITADKIVLGNTICEIAGTMPAVERTLYLEKITWNEDEETRVEIMLSDFPYQYIVVAGYASTNFNSDSSFLGDIIQNVNVFSSGSIDLRLRANSENSSIGIWSVSTKDRIVLSVPAYHACRVYGVNNISAYK